MKQLLNRLHLTLLCGLSFGLLFVSVQDVAVLAQQSSPCKVLQSEQLTTLRMCRRSERNITKGAFIELFLKYDKQFHGRSLDFVPDVSLIEYVFERGILKGNRNTQEKTSFYEALDKATVATLLVRIFPELRISELRNSADDLNSGQWFYRDAVSVIDRGILQIDDRRLFQPSETIRYRDAFEIVMALERLRFLEKHVKDLDGMLTRDDILSVNLFDVFRDAAKTFKDDDAVLDEQGVPQDELSVPVRVDVLVPQSESSEKVSDNPNTQATEFVAPTPSVGESQVEIFAVNISAGFGIGYDIRQLTFEILAGPAPTLQQSFGRARGTFLNIFLEVVGEDGERRRIAGPESVNSRGEIVFDGLDGNFFIKSGNKADVFVVADINASSQGASGYQFRLSKDKNVLLDQNQRNQPSSLLAP